MYLLALIFHVLINFLLGYGILTNVLKRKLLTKHICSIILIGIFMETSLCFLLLHVGTPLKVVTIIIIFLSIILNLKTFLTFSKVKVSSIFPPFFKRIKSIKWYEWGLILLIIEKISLIVWQLLRMPTYHSDALKYWSTFGKALYSGNNFSVDPENVNFLVRPLTLIVDYPIQIPIYRAIQATLNFEWNEFVARCDGLVFFLILCCLVGSFFQELTQKRWMSLGAVYLIASLPLQVWHAASGYADIAIEAYIAAAIISFIRREWFLCGLLMAGATWTKNDAIAMFLPGILAAGFIYHAFSKELKWSEKIKKMSQFAIGYFTVLPWLIYQAIYGISVFNKILAPFKPKEAEDTLGFNYYDPNDYKVVLIQRGELFEGSTPSYQLFWDYVFWGSSHGIFWVVIFIALFLLFKRMLLDLMGRSLLLFFLIYCGTVYFLFTYTAAYEFLLLETTIHRTLLQFSAAALIIIGYGMSLIPPKSPLQPTEKEHLLQDTTQD